MWLELVYKNKKLWNLLILSIILFYAFILRAEYFIYFKELPLEPDAQGFFELARQNKHFYQASVREPLAIFLIKIGLNIFGNKLWVVRLLSFIYSIVLVFLIYFIAKSIFNAFVGLGSAFIVAITPHLVQSSIRGLRVELYTIFIIVFLYILFINKKIPLNIRLFLTSIAGGLLCLIRMETLIICFLLLIYFFLTEGVWNIKEKLYLGCKIVGCLFIIVVIMSPFLINNFRAYQDPFYGQNLHAKFWRNQEFTEEYKEDSFITDTKGSYYGKPVTMFEYIFKLHTPGEVIFRYIQGYLFVFTRYLRFILQGRLWLVFLGMAGLGLILFSRARFLGIAFFVVLFPVAFILPLDTTGHRGVDIRFILPAYSLFSIFVMYSVNIFFIQVKRFLLRLKANN